MSEKSDIEALRALTSEPNNQTKIGRLRGLYDEIENLKKAGVKNKIILKTLNDIGFYINLNQLETMLYTIRKERKVRQHKTTAAEPHVITPKVNKEILQDNTQNQETKKESVQQELNGDDDLYKSDREARKAAQRERFNNI
ncbi:MAG: hypothetical protein ACXV79_02495 [Methylobacter sp.]